MQSAPTLVVPAFSGDFVRLFENLLPQPVDEEIFLTHGPRGAGLPKLSGWQWLMAKVFHVMSPHGDFAGHVKQVTGTDMSNSALSQRGISIISFAKVLDATVALCRVMDPGRDLIDDATRAEWTR